MALPVLATRASISRDHPLLRLEEDDLDFIVQFVLASGSLKEMAQLHGVSYPTIRASLDSVIDRLRQSMSGQARDEMTELLAGMVERGEITAGVAKRIRGLHRSVLERE